MTLDEALERADKHTLEDRDAIRRIADEVVRLRARQMDIVRELKNISNANSRNWPGDMQDQFEEWAKNRARAALASVGE